LLTQHVHRSYTEQAGGAGSFPIWGVNFTPQGYAWIR